MPDIEENPFMPRTRRDILYQIGTAMRYVAGTLFILNAPRIINDLIEKRVAPESPLEDPNNFNESYRPRNL